MSENTIGLAVKKLLDRIEIRYKLLLPSIAIWLLFFVGLHFFWLPVYLENKKQEFFNQQFMAVHLLDDALSGIKSQSDFIKLYDLMDHVLAEHPTWRAAGFYDQTGNSLYQSSIDEATNNKKFIKLKFDIVRSGNSLGRLEVYADTTQFLNNEAANIHRLEMILVALFGISALISVSLQDRWIKAPLQSLVVAVKRMADGDMSAALPGGVKDEIGELVFAFRTLSNSLQLTHFALQDEVKQAVNMAAELSESEQRFRTVFDSISDTLIIIDQQGIIKNVNPSAYKMLGYQNEELIGQPIQILIPIPDKENSGSYLAGFMPDNKAGVVGDPSREVIVLAKDGKQVPVDISVNVLNIGEKTHFIGVVRDVSAYKQFQEKLKAEKDLAQNYLNTASVIMIAIDNNGLVALVNNKACEVLGYTERELIGKNWFQLLFSDDIATELAAEYQLALQGETTFPEYFECNVKSNSDININTNEQEQQVIVWHTGILRDTNTGEFTGLIASGEDITESRKSDQARRALQKQLQQAQKMEAVGQLTGGIAHDFNNMLASIMGYSELAMVKVKQLEDEKLKQYVQQIHTSGERARDLVGKMLAFSRGKDSETPEPLHLNTVINELMPMLKSVIPSSVQIDVQLNNNLPAVLADSIDVQQTVMNLCINARDAMQSKGRITVRTRTVSKIDDVCASCHNTVTGDYVELLVEDTGPGIAGDKLIRLFEPFFSTKEVGKGTGLGLSVIHGVVHARHGHILVSSEEGVGTQFRILFQTVEQSREVDLANGEMQEDEEYVPGDSRNILVVDDEAAVAGFVGELLRVNGYRVHVETHPKNALTAFLSAPEKYDLLIVDQTMPEITGLQLADQLHVIQPELPVILCTGGSEAVKEDNVEELGVSAICKKPMESETLLRLVGEVLTNRSMPAKRAASG